MNSLSEIGGDQTIIVGRVELVPALARDEQRVTALNVAKGAENTVFLLADENYRVLSQDPAMADFTGVIAATLGKNFFVRSDSKPFFVLGGMLYLALGGKSTDRVFFPGGLKVSIKPGDKAVYIGTIQYHRNEFFDVSKVAIVDDYERANAEFKKTFGTKYPLRKALLTPIK